MKILIATDAWNSINGVVTTLENTIKELKQRGHEVFVIHPELFKTIKCPIYPEIKLSFPTKKQIKKLINNFKPDAVHVATEWMIGIQTRRVLKELGYSWSSSFHTRFDKYANEQFGFGEKIIWKTLEKIYKDDNYILVTTDHMKEELITGGFDKKKLIVWPRGVSDLFSPRIEKINDIPRFVNIGRVSIEKNLEEFYKLPLPGKKIQVGSGPMLETYKKKYPDVEFIGPKYGKELAEEYRKADVMVFPSKTDTYGLVIIEALKCGTPVASYPVIGPIDILENNITGIMNDNLEISCLECLTLNRKIIANKAKIYSWEYATDIFLKYLVKCKGE